MTGVRVGGLVDVVLSVSGLCVDEDRCVNVSEAGVVFHH